MPHSTSVPVRSVQRDLPASIIFSSKELKSYRRWQRHTTSLKTCDLGFLPTAIEYSNFQVWLAEKDDSGCFIEPLIPYESRERTCSTSFTSESKSKGGRDRIAVASLCRHELHPSTSQEEVERCPTCIISAHLNYMTVLTRALDEAGERTIFRKQKCLNYEQVFQAWYLGKLDMIQTVYTFQQDAHKEAQWQQCNPDLRCEVSTTASQAVETYWASIEDANFIPMGEENPRKTMQQKRVSFGEDTVFEAGRPQAYFWRNSPRYDRGKYECRSDDESELETEFESREEVKRIHILETEGNEISEGDTSDEEWEEFDYGEVEGTDFIVFGD